MIKFVTTVRHMGQQTHKRWPTDPDKKKICQLTDSLVYTHTVNCSERPAEVTQGNWRICQTHPDGGYKDVICDFERYQN